MSLPQAVVGSRGEWRPQGVLARHVDRFWWAPARAAEHFEVLPDGCVDLVLAVPEGASDLREGRWTLYGSSLQATPLPLSAGRYFGVRFKPGQARHFLSLDTPALLARHETLGTPPQGMQPRRAESWLVHSTAALLAQAPAESARVQRVDRALHLLDASGGQMDIARLARDAALSTRQLERLCLATTGVSPKWLARVTRFQAALAAVQGGGSTLAAIAQQTGYADQAHLARDFRRFTGVAPSQLPTG